MKNFICAICVICGSLMMMGGCETITSKIPPPTARTLTAAAAGVAFSQVPAADREEIANYMYAVAHAVRTLSGGKIPTPAEFQAAIAAFTPRGERWATLGSQLTGLWAGIYPQIGGNSRVALNYLEAIAAGAEDFAASFSRLSTPPPSP